MTFDLNGNRVRNAGRIEETAAKSKPLSEREVFFCVWDREEKQALGGLLARGMQSMGMTHSRQGAACEGTFSSHRRAPMIERYHALSAIMEGFLLELARTR